jgi:endonuclease G, mitochondrial
VAFQHLSDEGIKAVRDAVIARGLNTDASLAALVAGISPAFVGSVPIGSVPPNAKLLLLTEEMNKTRVLLNGQVPLAKWLSNAITLAGGTQEELVFRRALEQIAPDGRPDDHAPADVEAAPRVDGGALEIQIGDDDTLGIGFLLRGAVAARSVAKLRVHRHFDGNPSFLAGNAPDWGLGTGWLIGPDLLITNHHVIAARLPREPAATEADFGLQAASTEADFDHHDDSAQVKTVAVQALEASDPVLDYAVLRLAAGAGDRSPLRLRTNPLLRPQTSALRERVNVLQHPNGDPMRLGFRNNFVVTGSVTRLSYLTDTAGGSSGAPISDDAWYVAGLHRGWTTLGTPVDVWGKLIGRENYATPIGRILADLETRNSSVRDAILAAQPG